MGEKCTVDEFQEAPFLHEPQTGHPKGGHGPRNFTGFIADFVFQRKTKQCSIRDPPILAYVIKTFSNALT